MASLLNPVTWKALRDWRKRGWSDHAPQFVKEAIFRKYAIPGAPWVETGTFYGATTAVLAAMAPKVYTIEPAEKLFKRATKKFAGSNVEVINGTSEEVFPRLLPTLSGDLCFWLDGHYSAGSTYQGKTDCPIEDELSAIAANLAQMDRVSLLIDDVRCFTSTSEDFRDYPSIDFLVDWARAHGFTWRIEQDIFIMRNWT
jgi:hypothetical protein